MAFPGRPCLFRTAWEGHPTLRHSTARASWYLRFASFPRTRVIAARSHFREDRKCLPLKNGAARRVLFFIRNLQECQPQGTLLLVLAEQRQVKHRPERGGGGLLGCFGIGFSWAGIMNADPVMREG